MCLGIPMKIVEVKDNMAMAELGGVKREIGLSLVKDIKMGDFVIVHAGFAIDKLDEKEAQKNLSLLQELTIEEF